MLVTPHLSFAAYADDPERFDILIIPGGSGTRKLQHDAEVIDWIASQSRELERRRPGLLASVCTGALLLAGAGLLGGNRATSLHDAIDFLQSIYPAITVVSDHKYVDEGRILTSGGISAGIELAFHIVRRSYGLPVARATARYMEYDSVTLLEAGDTETRADA